MHHTTILFSPFCFDHLVLAPHYAYREACSPRHNEVVVLKECVALRRDYVLAEPRVHVLPAGDPRWSCEPEYLVQVASWLYELADPELTAVYADSQDEKS